MPDQPGSQGEMPNDSPEASEIDEGQKPFTPEEVAKLKEALKKANKEAATYRHESNELKAYREQAEREKLSDVERKQAEATAAQQRLEERTKVYRNRLVTSEVAAYAGQLAIKPEQIQKLIESDIEYDDDEMPKNISDLIKQLMKDNPTLVVKQSGANVGATNPTRNSVVGSNIEALVAKMKNGTLTDKEYEALSPQQKAEFRKILRL